MKFFILLLQCCSQTDDESEIESKFVDFRKSKVFAEHFLLYFGCDMTGKDSVDWSIEENNKKVRKIRKKKGAIPIQNDALFCDYSKFKQIIKNRIIKSNDDALNIMNLFVKTLMIMIDNMMPISGMSVCYIYVFSCFIFVV